MASSSRVPVSIQCKKKVEMGFTYFISPRQGEGMEYNKHQHRQGCGCGHGCGRDVDVGVCLVVVLVVVVGVVVGMVMGVGMSVWGKESGGE